jgi:hypothetical protein
VFTSTSNSASYSTSNSTVTNSSTGTSNSTSNVFADEFNVFGIRRRGRGFLEGDIDVIRTMKLGNFLQPRIM